MKQKNIDYAVANVLAHEIGFHDIAGYYDHFGPEIKDDKSYIDRPSVDEKFFTQVLEFSNGVKKEILRELDLDK